MSVISPHEPKICKRNITRLLASESCIKSSGQTHEVLTNLIK